MIHANELRLGNYLLNTICERETIAKVTAIDNNRIGCVMRDVKVDLFYKFDVYQPIPLTDELLENFPGYQSLKIESDTEGIFFNAGNGLFVKLNYLHQLQNLYYFLTGEEPVLNLESVAETELSGTADCP